MTASIDRRLSALVVGLGTLAVAFGVLAGLQPQYALAGVIALAFVGAVLANLTAGLCVLVILGYIDVGDLPVTKIVGFTLAFSWLAMVFTRPRLRRFVGDSPALMYAIVLLASWMVLSLAWAEDIGVATAALTRYFPSLLLLPIVYTAVRTNRHVVWVLGTIVAAGGMAALVGLLAPPADPGLAFGDSVRSTGPVGDPNELAAGLVVAVALAGAFAFNPGFATGARLACGGIAALGVLGIFTSLSRGGLVSLGIAMVAAVLAAGRWRLRAAVIALVVVASAGLYFATFASLPARERVVNVGGGTGRLDLWTVGARMATQEPLLGVGVGNFRVSAIHYLLRPGAIERGEFIITTPKVAHNTYLQFFAELGILGGTLFIGIVLVSVACVIRALRTFRDHSDVRMELLTRGVLVALIGYLAAIVFISENHSKLMWIMLALGPALLAVARRSSSSEAEASW